jgi:hypothetical protein
VLEKFMTKRNVNLLHTVPKQDILNSKTLHVVTRSGVGKDNYLEAPNRQGNKVPYPDPDKEERIMQEVLNFFKNIDQDKSNEG